MKRAIIAASSVLALTLLSVSLGAAAWSVTSTPSTAVITFDDAAQQVTLTIPTPACPTSQPNCMWKFFLNEPKLSVDVAIVYGTSGTLTLAYPKNFCGVIQADAYVGPPWVAKRGFQHTIEDCSGPVGPTTGTPASTTTTEQPGQASATSTTTSTVPGPVDAAGSGPPPAAATGSPPSAPASASGGGSASTSHNAPADATSGTPASAPVHAATGLLPFTGVGFEQFLLIGLSLVVLGLALLTSTESGRRMARRLAATVHRR
ncbi:MAG TPA: hypothetical protein VGY51_06660 [Acidimicrobiales bacterium]|jgi:hypothetical protein|nr:hypothetical protein [Acidimicrobiales bacterium]